MSYAIGQAVMITFNLETQIVFVYQETMGEYIKTSGLINPNDSATVLTVSTRPATEAEILAEAVKHGWNPYRSWQYKSPFKWLEIVSLGGLDGWTIEPINTPLSKDFAAYGQECITAHRLITALNLAK